eukprot:CAMPEP_0177604452 /NCGR_PEP_ID=MMETSP0419_2-20121207/16125_1 /TAXON_ID=582737 /ORGANISM="Tetraselmis sp., Strain GSL018" /LENGTH=329 /DNA_ID=CAMNT_0019098435 /DNA_START=90 /DNA_END=1076 /DNA_ORIENTATION=+
MGKGNANDEPLSDVTVEAKRRKLVGCKNFQRVNPKSDKFDIKRFHHIEFWCGDATNTYKRFGHGLGMPLAARSDQSTGNSRYASYTLRSGELVFVFTSPYSAACAQPGGAAPMPWLDAGRHWEFVRKHGLAVRAVGLSVADAAEAWRVSTANGARGVLPPTTIEDPESGTAQELCEVELYGDVVLRFVGGTFKGPGIAGYKAEAPPEGSTGFGLNRLDHAVGNVHDLLEQVNYMEKITGDPAQPPRGSSRIHGGSPPSPLPYLSCTKERRGRGRRDWRPSCCFPPRGSLSSCRRSPREFACASALCCGRAFCLPRLPLARAAVFSTDAR